MLIVQSIFKHVASENGPLVLILQSYSQIFILLKQIDWNLVELIWTTKCMIKIFRGTGVVTLSKTPPSYEQLLPLPTPGFKMFWKDPLMTLEIWGIFLARHYG